MQEGFKHKNPQVKTESLKFLVRCLRTTPFAPTKQETQIIGEACTKLLADTVEPVRVAAQEALGTLMKIIGERAMIQFLDGVDDIRKAKIKEFYEKAEIKARQRPVPTAKAAGGGPSAKRGPPAATGGTVGGPTKTIGKPATTTAAAATGASGIARTSSLKRPVSTASSIAVEREPDSPKKATIARPGMRPPATSSSSSASSATGGAPASSRFAPRQSMAPAARSGSPVQASAPKKVVTEEPPKLGRGLMGRVAPPPFPGLSPV